MADRQKVPLVKWEKLIQGDRPSRGKYKIPMNLSWHLPYTNFEESRHPYTDCESFERAFVFVCGMP